MNRRVSGIKATTDQSPGARSCERLRASRCVCLLAYSALQRCCVELFILEALRFNLKRHTTILLLGYAQSTEELAARMRPHCGHRNAAPLWVQRRSRSRPALDQRAFRRQPAGSASLPALGRLWVSPNSPSGWRSKPMNHNAFYESRPCLRNAGVTGSSPVGGTSPSTGNLRKCAQMLREAR